MTKHRLLLPVLAALGLAGCVAYPAPVYGPPPRAAYAGPPPAYYAPPPAYYYGPPGVSLNFRF